MRVYELLVLHEGKEAVHEGGRVQNILEHQQERQGHTQMLLLMVNADNRSIVFVTTLRYTWTAIGIPYVLCAEVREEVLEAVVLQEVRLSGAVSTDDR